MTGRNCIENISFPISIFAGYGVLLARTDFTADSCDWRSVFPRPPPPPFVFFLNFLDVLDIKHRHIESNNII
jgi:hypothetical protein